jgi:hypothetical protein
LNLKSNLSVEWVLHFLECLQKNNKIKVMLDLGTEASITFLPEKHLCQRHNITG